MPNFMILFYGLSNLLSHFIQLLDLKVPKLLKSYGIVRWGLGTTTCNVTLRQLNIGCIYSNPNLEGGPHHLKRNTSTEITCL